LKKRILTLMKKTRFLYTLLAAIIILAAMAGCTRVQPWEREYLADPIMRPDFGKEERAVKEHTLATREGSAGSFGVSGGGCGCN